MQIMFNSKSGDFWGLRFLNRDGTPILTCGQMVEDLNCFSTLECTIKKFNLHENQRIVGLKSNLAIFGRALHFGLQFVLMAPTTKKVLLKLLVNKSKVSCTGRGLGKLPEGVFREVIRFVRF